MPCQTPRPIRRQGPRHPKDLQSRDKVFLAVLTLAGLWSTRFPDGWVSVDQFRKMGEWGGAAPDPDSMRDELRRTLRKLPQLAEPLVVESRPTPGVRRGPGSRNSTAASARPCRFACGPGSLVKE